MDTMQELSSIQEDAIVLMFIGIYIIIFGYWSKWYIYGMLRGGVESENLINEIKKRHKLNQKITLSQKIYIWFENRNGIKLCNKIGVILIIIGVVLLMLN